MLDYSKVRFLWRGDAGRKVSSGRYDKIYDMGPRAATGDATFATAATRPIVDELSDWYGLAVDPAATNLVLYSQEFDNAYWTKSNTTITANATTAPDGTTTADKLIASNGTQVSQVFRQIPGGGVFTYTASVFAKAGEFNFASLILSDDNSWLAQAVFDLTTGAVTKTFTASTGVIIATSAEPCSDGSFRLRLSMSATFVGNTFYRVNPYSTGTPANPPLHTTVGDGTSGIFIWGAQLETGSVATQYKPTTSGTTAYSAVVAPITDAIPVTGTIIVWDNMVNAYASGFSHRIFDSEDLSTTFLRIRKNDVDVNKLDIMVHNNTAALSSDLQWHPTNQRKRWFFAMTFNGTTVQVYRGDVQGNISKVIDTTYTPSNAAIRDMFLHTSAGGSGQIGASFLDIMTYDDVMTEAEIEEIYYGTIPVFQQTGYAGTFVDKFRQKVQAEPSSTYDTTLESTVLADWSVDIFGVYDADASAFFTRGFEDGATLENLDATNTFILALKAL
jgi:hypothetical protein